MTIIEIETEFGFSTSDISYPIKASIHNKIKREQSCLFSSQTDACKAVTDWFCHFKYRHSFKQNFKCKYTISAALECEFKALVKTSSKFSDVAVTKFVPRPFDQICKQITSLQGHY